MSENSGPDEAPKDHERGPIVAGKELPPAGMAYVVHRVGQLLSELERASSAVPVGVSISPERERARYIFVLAHVSKFIQEIGGTLEQSRYIHNLAETLGDLDHGVVHPILEPRHGRSRGDTSQVWLARGRVAAGLEALMRSEPSMSRPHAAKLALKSLPGISRLLSAKSKDPAAAVLSWHDDFRRGNKSRIKNAGWADALQIGTEALESCDGQPATLKALALAQFQLASRI